MYAVEYLEITPQNYNISQERIFENNPEVKPMLEQGDLELRSRLDPREDTETKDEMTKIYRETIEGECDATIKTMG